MCTTGNQYWDCNTMQHAATRCNTLQHAATTGNQYCLLLLLVCCFMSEFPKSVNTSAMRALLGGHANDMRGNTHEWQRFALVLTPLEIPRIPRILGRIRVSSRTCHSRMTCAGGHANDMRSSQILFPLYVLPSHSWNSTAFLFPVQLEFDMRSSQIVH